MYLTRLEISGFKSFVKKGTLSFTSPISAIVGPNGSGKSNVAEAFRFVLGEQSIKSMRGKRGEDLIFNGGGDGSGKLNRASVKVAFDNSRRLFDLDFDEVTIERVVHRDSTNEYFINGSAARLKDIVELLSRAHIGASGHHIISQGEADRILNATIRERREMIEDALGLKIYQYKKLESRRKLEKTEEHMKSVESLRREIAPHLKFLKKQVEKVEKVQVLRNELEQLYKEYLKREEDYLKLEKADIEHIKTPLVRDLAEQDKEIEEARRVLEESKNRDERSNELMMLEASLQHIRTKKDAIMRDLGKIEGEISASERGITREQERLAKEEYRTVYLKDVEEVVHKVMASESVVEIKELLKTFVSRHRSQEESTVMSSHVQELAGLKSARVNLEVELKKILDLEQKELLEYNTLRIRIEKEKDSNRDAEKNVFRIIARQNELRNQLSHLKVREEKYLLNEEAYKRELQEAYMILGREAMSYADLVVTPESRDAQYARYKIIEKLKIRIEDSGAGNSVDIMREYTEVEERDRFLERELIDLENSKVSLLALIADLDARIDLEFREGILKINVQFQEFFIRMFGGGSASLQVVREKRRKKKSDTTMSAVLEDTSIDTGMLVEEEDGEEGIDIDVHLPRKKVKGLMMLSGGERALTSIALLFAVSQVNPPPFIILDETDAALDEANSRKYGDMISNLSTYSQLILITHNRETMSRAGVLYGVTMGNDGGSKLLSIQFDEAIKVAK